MIQQVLSGIGGIGNYGVVSILLFFAVFAGVLIWAFSRKKSYLQEMSALPLDSGETGAENSSKKTSDPETHHE